MKKLIRRIFTMLLVLVLIVSITAVAFARGGKAYFTDVQVGTWAYLTSGYKTNTGGNGTVGVTSSAGGTTSLYSLGLSTSYYKIGCQTGATASIPMQSPYSAAYQSVPLYGYGTGGTTHVTGYFNAN
jgi:hypothetical protein